MLFNLIAIDIFTDILYRIRQSTQTKRRRNRSNRRTQTVKPNNLEAASTTKVAAPKPAAPSVPPAVAAPTLNQRAQSPTKPAAIPTGVEPPKRHRIRHRKRNKSQQVESSATDLKPDPIAVIQPAAAKVPVIESTTAVVTTKPVPSVAHPIMKSTAGGGGGVPSPSKEQILAEREAKRLAKQAAKHKIVDSARDIGDTSPVKNAPVAEASKPIVAAEKPKSIAAQVTESSEKSREEVMAEREAKKLAKLAAKNKGKASDGGAVVAASAPAAASPAAAVIAVTAKVEEMKIADKPVLSKAERRAKQEAQRAAKAAALGGGALAEKKLAAVSTTKPTESAKSSDLVSCYSNS